MMRLACFAMVFGLAAAHMSSVDHCTHRCEAENSCRSSLDSMVCENSCQAMCKCKSMQHRMLNKPKHCTASLIAMHRKKLASFRASKSYLHKVVLQDRSEDAAQLEAGAEHFQGFIPLSEYWGSSTKAEAAVLAPKQRMLNQHVGFVQATDAQPWSPAAGKTHQKSALVQEAPKEKAPVKAAVLAKAPAPAKELTAAKVTPAKVVTPSKVTPAIVAGAKVVAPPKELAAAQIQQDPCAGCAEPFVAQHQKCMASMSNNPCTKQYTGVAFDNSCCGIKQQHGRCLSCKSQGARPHYGSKWTDQLNSGKTVTEGYKK